MPNKQSPFLSIDNLSARYDKEDIIHNIGFTLEKGEIACFLGNSGCGKSTLLRTISGFIPITQGEITLADKTLSSTKIQTPIEQRGIGMVFQDHALFPHLTVLENVNFGLRGLPTKKRTERCQHLLCLLKIDSLQAHYPHQLSGGQSQRVALARALAPQPEILLLDEPFASLDISLKNSLTIEIKQLLKALKITAIFVTHDHNEAFTIADKIAILHEGKLLHWGSPFDVYHLPKNRFVADFLGEGVFIHGEKKHATTIKTPLGDISANTFHTDTQSHSVQVLLRPDDIVYDKKSDLKGRVIEQFFRGANTLYHLETENNVIVYCLLASHTSFQLNDWLPFRIDIEHLVYFAQ